MTIIEQNDLIWCRLPPPSSSYSTICWSFIMAKTPKREYVHTHTHTLMGVMCSLSHWPTWVAWLNQLVLPPFCCYIFLYPHSLTVTRAIHWCNEHWPKSPPPPSPPPMTILFALNRTMLMSFRDSWSFFPSLTCIHSSCCRVFIHSTHVEGSFVIWKFRHLRQLLLLLLLLIDTITHCHILLQFDRTRTHSHIFTH